MTKKTIHTSSVVAALITSRARVAVLSLLFLGSGARFYLREIAERTGLQIRAVQTEVTRLEASGLLLSQTEGNRKYFRANPDSPIYPELRSLLLKTVGLEAALRDHLQSASAEIAVAFMFGSIARGEDAPDSDVDLMVVGSIRGRELSRLLRPASESLGREINPLIIAPAEFKKRLAQEDHFLRSVLSEPKLFLVGGPDDLERLAAAGAAAPTQVKSSGSG